MAPAGDQLDERGSSWGAVRKRENEVGCPDECERGFRWNVHTTGGRQGNAQMRRSNEARRGSGRAVAKTAALLRLLVIRRRVMRSVRDRRVRRVTAGMRARLDSQSAMHDAQMQLHRLGEADGEPRRDRYCQGAKWSRMRHASNISSLFTSVRQFQRKTVAMRRNGLCW
jgi:hypothetical protein